MIIHNINKGEHMLKPTSSYKMSKSTKRSLATSKMIDPHYRGQQKRTMIQAELYAAIQPKREKKPRNTPDLELDQ